MGLHTNAVDRDALLLEGLDEVDVSGGLGRRAFDVVVVGVEFGERIRFASCMESSRDEVGTGGVEEDILAEGSVIVNDL